MKKLQQQRGASILLALLLLLLATMVSTVILTAVASVSHHLTRDREAQQNYLAVSSAAEAVRDSIRGARYQRIVTTTTTYSWDQWDRRTSSTKTDVSETEPSGLMGKWLEACIDENGQWVASYQDTTTIALSQGTEQPLSPVRMIFTMTRKDENTANFLLTFSLVDEGDEDCRMTLSMTGSRVVKSNTTGSSSEGKKQTVTTTAIDWTKTSTITKGSGEGGT